MSHSESAWVSLSPALPNSHSEQPADLVEYVPEECLTSDPREQSSAPGSRQLSQHILSLITINTDDL